MNNFERSIQQETIDKTIKDTNEIVRKMKDLSAETLVVFGVGGSSLGAQAVISAVNFGPLYKNTNVVFMGDNLSEEYLNELTSLRLRSKKLALVFNSLSGTTYETNVAYDYIMNFRDELDIVYKCAVTTFKGFEKIKEKGFDDIVLLPDDTSGRYSVFTEIGTIPMRFVGIDINSFLQSAANAINIKEQDNQNKSRKDIIYDNFIAAQLDDYRPLHIISNTNIKFYDLNKWYQQLIMESTGKNNLGLAVLPVDYPADFHSIEQYLQNGHLKFTEIAIADDLDLHRVIMEAHKGDVIASYFMREDDDLISILGEIMSTLCYFCIDLCEKFFKVCPFDQPGVEVYKGVAKKF